jgi:serine/threonine-protein kinase RsbW
VERGRDEDRTDEIRQEVRSWPIESGARRSLAGRANGGVRLEIALCLPNEASTVAVVRDVVVGALRRLSVSTSDVDDIRLALSEACTNVIEHSGADDEYEVRLEVDDERCEIRVVDSGRGLDFAAVERGWPDPMSPRGRGLAIISSVVDGAEFSSEPEAGTMVRLVKRLSPKGSAPDERLDGQGAGDV